MELNINTLNSKSVYKVMRALCADLRPDVSEWPERAGRAAQPQPGGAGAGLAGGHRAGAEARQRQVRLLPA